MISNTLSKKLLTFVSSREALNFLFLISGLSLVICLYFLKAKDAETLTTQFSQNKTQHEAPIISPHIKISSIKIQLPTHTSHVMKNLVSNEQFHAFTRATSYQSWREKQGLLPSWRFPNSTQTHESWEDSPLAPALWLNRADSEAFCVWMSERNQDLSPYLDHEKTVLWKKGGLRLPTVEELNVIQGKTPDSSLEHWEWTANTLQDFNQSFSSGSDYLTSWHPRSPLRHRRDQDMSLKESVATGFRLAWTESISDKELSNLSEVQKSSHNKKIL